MLGNIRYEKMFYMLNVAWIVNVEITKTLWML
jgi:hypothetical protein